MPGIMFDGFGCPGDGASVRAERGGLLSAFSILIQSTTGELEAVSTKIRDTFGSFGFIWHIWRM